MHKFRNWIEKKFNNTVFGDALCGILDLHEKNKTAFAIEMVISYILCAVLTGISLLALFNISGGNYSLSLFNIFAAYVNKGILLSLVIFVIIQCIIFRFIRLFSVSYKKNTENNYDRSLEGTYGTSGNMEREEMERTFVIAPIEKNKETIYGRDPKNPNNLVSQKYPLRKLNRNTLVVAAPSAGKSATYVIPLILQILRRRESAIISDPKSELFTILSELAKMCKYEVRILNLNPMLLNNSDPCNFMMYVGDDPDKAQVMSSAIISNTTSGSDLFDFWTEGALNLLQALILRINIGNDYKPEEKNLPQLFTYITSHDLESMELDFEMLSDDHIAKAPFSIFKNGEEKVKKQVIQGLAIKLKLFNSPRLKTILSRTEGGIDILNPGRKPCLYFVGSNDQDASMAPIVSLFYTLLYQELVRYADRRADLQLPVPVHMVLDEYANMGTIPDFEKKLSTVRSRGIITHIIIQDINQLKTKHPHDTWKTVVSDCDYHICLKTIDEDTMKWWSLHSGEQTVTVKNKNYVRNKTDILNLHTEERITEGQGKRQTYTLDEIARLKDDEVLVYVSQRKILKLKTYFWKDHPYAKYVKEVLPAQHYPFWRLIDDGVVDETFDYDNEPSFIIELKPDEKVELDNIDTDELLGINSKKAAVNNTARQIIKKVKNIRDNTECEQSVKEENSVPEIKVNYIRDKEYSSSLEEKTIPAQKNTTAKKQPATHSNTKSGKKTNSTSNTVNQLNKNIERQKNADSGSVPEDNGKIEVVSESASDTNEFLKNQFSFWDSEDAFSDAKEL